MCFNDKNRIKTFIRFQGSTLPLWEDQLSVKDDHKLYDVRSLQRLTKNFYKSDFDPKTYCGSWPVHLPVPAKRMTAPKSHFG